MPRVAVRLLGVKKDANLWRWCEVRQKRWVQAMIFFPEEEKFYENDHDFSF